MQNKNRGAAMVEFALVAPFFFMLMACIIYGAMVMHDINSLNEITRNAARYGSVIASGVTTDEKAAAEKTAEVKKFIRNKAANGGLFLYELKDDKVWVDEKSEVKMGASNEKAIKVTASAVMKDGLPTFLFLDYLPDSLKTISSTITMRRED